MENNKIIVAPVILKGMNYLLWSRTMKTTLCSRGLWTHVQLDKAPTSTAIVEEGNQGATDVEAKWFQEDQLVLAILQSSLDASLLSAYSYCDNAKELWETLQNVYGNTSNLMRIFEVKKALSQMRQEGTDFTKHYGEFRALWAELEMLRPDTNDNNIRNERKEQDKVFGLLMTLSSTYTDLIHHLLREDKLPTLEAVCAKIQREQGSHQLFGHKEDLVVAHKGFYKPEDRKKWNDKECEHCKQMGHLKKECWVLHPHLKPQWMKTNQYKSHQNKSWTRPNPNRSKPFQASMASTSTTTLLMNKARHLLQYQLLLLGMSQNHTWRLSSKRLTMVKSWVNLFMPLFKVQMNLNL